MFQSSVSEGLDFLCFSLLQAAEQIQETSNIHKSVEDGVVNASHKVDQVYELDNIFFNSFIFSILFFCFALFVRFDIWFVLFCFCFVLFFFLAGNAKIIDRVFS